MRAPRILLTAAVAAAMTSPATGALAAPGVVVTCGSTVSTDARLDRDLVCTDGRGITLLAGAELDLGGHRLVGPGPESGRAVNFESGPASSVTNGTIEGWAVGLGHDDVFGGGAGDTVIEVRAVTFRGNGTALSAFAQDYVVESSQFVQNGTAISSDNAAVTVRGSAFVQNDTAASVSFGATHHFQDSSFLRNGTAIDCVNVPLVVERSTFTRNGSGIGAFECGAIRLVDSTLSRNGTAYRAMLGGTDQILRNTFVNNDVAVDALSAADLTDNRFTGNGTAVRAPADNPPTGPAFLTLERNRFTRNGDAVVLEGPSELGGNVAIANRGYGIFAPEAVDLGGNVAFANGREPQCTGVVCAGP